MILGPGKNARPLPCSAHGTLRKAAHAHSPGHPTAPRKARSLRAPCGPKRIHGSLPATLPRRYPSGESLRSVHPEHRFRGTSAFCNHPLPPNWLGLVVWCVYRHQAFKSQSTNQNHKLGLIRNKAPHRQGRKNKTTKQITPLERPALLAKDLGQSGPIGSQDADAAFDVQVGRGVLKEWRLQAKSRQARAAKGGTCPKLGHQAIYGAHSYCVGGGENSFGLYIGQERKACS